MPGMLSKLYLTANEVGIFRGSSANLSGKGFARMTFKAHATSNEDFENWVNQVKSSSSELNSEVYKQLVMPSENNPPASYVLGESDFFYRILMSTRKPHPHRGHDVW
jgi:cytochrome o ubiquinol oxidase subunit 2